MSGLVFGVHWDDRQNVIGETVDTHPKIRSNANLEGRQPVPTDLQRCGSLRIIPREVFAQQGNSTTEEIRGLLIDVGAGLPEDRCTGSVRSKVAAEEHAVGIFCSR